MPGVFISYRRDDSSGYSGRLHEHLSRRFGRSRIFLDIDDVPIGQDFARVLSERIASCDVVIVLIGKRWQTLVGRSGRRRLDDPDDFVRLEIATALERGIPIVPVLVEGAQMPSASALPSSISQLAYLNAFEISDRFFEESLKRLAKQISPWLKGGSAPRWNAVSALRIDAASRRVAAIAGVLLTLLLSGLVVTSIVDRPRPQSLPAAAKTAAPAPKAAAPEIPVVPAVEDRIPSRITQLPKIVEAARGGFAFEDAAGVNGPRNPKVIWNVLFKREQMEQWAVAGDGTLYISTRGVEYSSLVAIRDGKEQWAYKISEPPRLELPRFQIMLDGRIWAQAVEGRMLCFNTRGEGGRMTFDGQSEAGFESQVLTTRMRAHGYDSSHASGLIPQCRLDEATGYLRTSESNGHPGLDTWKMRLDGDCVASAGDRQGNALLATDTGTIYSINPEGHTRWTYKSDCKVGHIIPLLGDESICVCPDSFWGLRGGKRQWKLPPFDSSQIESLQRDPVLFDKANTIYLSSSKPGASVIAIDHDGTVLWRSDLGRAVKPRLLDKEGRLYVSWELDGLGIACLADR